MEFVLIKKGKVAVDHSRHTGIYNVPTYFQVGLVGAGGIGAMTALVLSKMGVVQLTVWDADTVSEANIATQWHRVSDIGKEKVFSLARSLEEFSDELLFEPMAEWVTEQTTFPRFDLLISAVDSVTARQAIWKAVTNAYNIDWYLDQRMGAEIYQHFLVDMSDPTGVRKYAEALMNLHEDDVVEAPCTAKSTFYTASFGGGHAGKELRKILRNIAQPHRLVHYIVENQIDTFRL
jgi:hypothetical protein